MLTAFGNKQVGIVTLKSMPILYIASTSIAYISGTLPLNSKLKIDGPWLLKPIKSIYLPHRFQNIV